MPPCPAEIPWRDLAAAVTENAIADLADTRRCIRRDAAQFIGSRAFGLWLAMAGVQITPAECREALRRRGLL